MPQFIAIREFLTYLTKIFVLKYVISVLLMQLSEMAGYRLAVMNSIVFFINTCFSLTWPFLGIWHVTMLFHGSFTHECVLISGL
jgi:hypothetical protein